MGTSKGYGGSSSGLVPSWVDDPAPGVEPGTAPASPAAPADGGAVPTAPGNPADGSPAAAPGPGKPATGNTKPDTSGAGSFQGARANFTRFAKTGSRRALGSALADYVGKSTGGAGRAARRMGSSRASGARLLGVVRDVQRFGPVEFLRQFNLTELVGRPAAVVFVAIMEFVCPPGGSVDEAIARQAMLETIGDLAEAGVGDFDSMTPPQMEEFFLDFVARSIEGRVMADLGTRGVTLPDDVAAVEAAQDQLHDFVAGCTQTQLADRLDGLASLADRDVERVVNQIYEAAFDLVAAAGEAEQ